MKGKHHFRNVLCILIGLLGILKMDSFFIGTLFVGAGVFEYVFDGVGKNALDTSDEKRINSYHFHTIEPINLKRWREINKRFSGMQIVQDALDAGDDTEYTITYQGISTRYKTYMFRDYGLTEISPYDFRHTREDLAQYIRKMKSRAGSQKWYLTNIDNVPCVYPESMRQAKIDDALKRHGATW